MKKAVAELPGEEVASLTGEKLSLRIDPERGFECNGPSVNSQVLTTQCDNAVWKSSAAMLFEAVEGADLRRLLLSNSTHEGALRWVAGLQSGRANTARMVRCVA
jgi:hypothetical protein